jgi:serine/threonine protein kinase
MLHGQYEIPAPIRRGGFGYVYPPRDDLARDEAMLRRFLADARATMRHSHEHIANTRTVFLKDGNYYIVMECMAGDPLELCLRPFCSPKKGGGQLRESAGRL